MDHEDYEWKNAHPAQEGWYWYWHPDFQKPFPICVVFVRNESKCEWDYRPSKYPAGPEHEWWKFTGVGQEGPPTPGVCNKLT